MPRHQHCILHLIYSDILEEGLRLAEACDLHDFIDWKPCFISIRCETPPGRMGFDEFKFRLVDLDYVFSIVLPDCGFS